MTTTLFVRKVGSKATKLLTLGGEPGKWAVTDGDGELATARLRLSSYELEIDAGDRHLTGHLPMPLTGHPEEFEVVDDTTGQKTIDGQIVSGGRAEHGAYAEEWKVTLANGQAVSWFYARRPDRLGFYDASGAPILRFGHDPSFDTSAKGGTFRILLRFWGAAAASADRYIAQVEDGAVGRLVPPDDVPVLALLALWLERTADSRYNYLLAPMT